VHEWQLAIKVLPRLYTCLKAKAESRYETAMAIKTHSMLQAHETVGGQGQVEVALMSSKRALVSRNSDAMELNLVWAKIWLNTNRAQNVGRGMLFAVGKGQTPALQHYPQQIERHLKASRLESVMHRRGVPCRGGRLGVAPMAAISPSSSSTEDEFLLMRDSYQSFRLRIPRGILHSDVMVNFTVYLSEALAIDPSWSSPALDSLQSNEILLGDMHGRVHRLPRPQVPMVHVEQQQQAPH